MPSFLFPSRALFTVRRTPAGEQWVPACRHGVLHTLLALPALGQTRPAGRAPRGRPSAHAVPVRAPCGGMLLTVRLTGLFSPRVCVCSSGEEAARAVGVQPLHQVSLPITLFYIFHHAVRCSKSRLTTGGGSFGHGNACRLGGRIRPGAGPGCRGKNFCRRRERDLLVFALSLSLSPVYTRAEREREREREREVSALVNETRQMMHR